MLISEIQHNRAIQERLRTDDIAASDRLDVPTISYLEHPTDPATRDRFRQFLNLAVNTGAIRAEEAFTPLPITETVEVKPPANPYPTPYTAIPHRQATVIRAVRLPTIARQDYRQWREQCPPSLLSEEMTLIARWIPAAPQRRPPTQKPAEGRQDALGVAIQTAIEALPGPATLNAVFHQLATDDPTRTVTDVSNDGKCLIWIADNGETQSLSRSALQKRLSRLQAR